MGHLGWLDARIRAIIRGTEGSGLGWFFLCSLCTRSNIVSTCTLDRMMTRLSRSLTSTIMRISS